MKKSTVTVDTTLDWSDALQEAVDQMIDLQHRLAMGHETYYEDLKFAHAAERFVKVYRGLKKEVSHE